MSHVILQVLELLLKEWKKDKSNKVLIFTKSVKLLEMLEFHLNSRGSSEIVFKLDAIMTENDRLQIPKTISDEIGRAHV